MYRKLASLAAALAIAAASIGPASADPLTQTLSVTVSYADLDLTRMEGVKTMSIRLVRAADRVCGTVSRHEAPAYRRIVEKCRKKAIGVAVASIDAPLLTTLYEGSEGSRFAGL